jgi:hypothetical protein
MVSTVAPIFSPSAVEEWEAASEPMMKVDGRKQDKVLSGRPGREGEGKRDQLNGKGVIYLAPHKITFTKSEQAQGGFQRLQVGK